MPLKTKAQALLYEVRLLPRSFTAIDFETTSLDPTKGAIIEIGAVKFTDGEVVATFNAMVCQDPELYPIDAEITKLTGHTAEDVARGMGAEAAINILIEFIGGDLIVGQNVLFDYSFLSAAATTYNYEYAQNSLLDTLTIGRDRKAYPHKLASLCNYYGIENEGEWHSAYYDALMTGQLLLAMHAEDYKYPPGKQVADYINVIGYRRKYGEPEWSPDWVTLKAQGHTIVNENKKNK